jgi:hypothetical protein
VLCVLQTWMCVRYFSSLTCDWYYSFSCVHVKLVFQSHKQALTTTSWLFWRAARPSDHFCVVKIWNKRATLLWTTTYTISKKFKLSVDDQSQWRDRRARWSLGCIVGKYGKWTACIGGGAVGWLNQWKSRLFSNQQGDRPSIHTLHKEIIPDWTMRFFI